MGFLVIHTDPHHTDFRHEQAELDAIGATLRPLNVTTEEEVAAACQEADGLLVTYAKVGKIALAGMPKLKIVVRTGVGYDSLDVPAATERKVMVANVPDYCVSDLTEHTMALLLTWWRRILELDTQVRTEGWGRPVKPVYRLEGKTLGILGMGRMGQALAVGLVREAAVRALAVAGITWNDIDAVIVGKAPGMFVGMVMPEVYLTDALGANGKHMLRVHTAGSVGGSTALVAASHVQSGMFRRVLTVAFEKQSESNAMWALSSPQPLSTHLNAGAGGYFAPIIREYMRRSGAPYDVGIKEAVKDRLHGARNPLAHLQLPNIAMKEVEESMMLWDPIRFLEACPSSDGACAMVIVDEDLAARSPKPPAWIRGGAMRFINNPTLKYRNLIILRRPELCRKVLSFWRRDY